MACSGSDFCLPLRLLNKHCEVVNVDGGHRLPAASFRASRALPFALDADADRAIQATFASLVAGEGEINRNVDLDSRGSAHSCQWYAEDIVWFDFAAICEGPRSQNDYIDMARVSRGDDQQCANRWARQ